MVRDTSQFIGDVTGLALLGLTEMLMDLLVLTRYYWDTEVYRCSVQGGVPKHPFSIGCLGVVGQTLCNYDLEAAHFSFANLAFQFCNLAILHLKLQKFNSFTTLVQCQFWARDI